MFGKSLLFTCLFIYIYTYSLCVDAERFINEVVLDEKYDFILKWKLDEQNIIFEMSAVTSGYVAIGFSPNGGMPGSDIVVGWVKNGKAFISDRHATAYAKPEADTSQDYTLLYGREEGGRTTIGFSRALKTCDDKDNVLNDDTMRIIWAVNNLDPEDYDDLSYHGSSRGVRSVLLTAAIENRVELPHDAEYFEMFMPNVTVSSDRDTTYWCASFAVPRFERPVHIVLAETIVQKGHEYLVHHLIMYGCKGTNTSWSSRCNSERMPPDLQACDRMMYGWAIGGGPLVLPEHVGISLGRKSDPTVIFIEMHYDNPALSPDFHDNSGVRLYYTPTLRQYEADVWALGENVTPLQSIPPNETSFKTFGVCFSNCTKKVLQEDIKLMLVMLHSHIAARKISLQQYRNGKLIADLAIDDNYDFNLQENRYLKPEKIIKAGDDLVVTCTYNTVGRTYITTGGQSTKNEMCLAYLLYYPRQTLAGSCLSNPSLQAYFEAFNIPAGSCEAEACLDTLASSVDPETLRQGLYDVSYKGKRLDICVDTDFEQVDGVPYPEEFPVWFSENDRMEDTNDVCSEPNNSPSSSVTLRAASSTIAALILIVSWSLTL